MGVPACQTTQPAYEPGYYVPGRIVERAKKRYSWRQDNTAFREMLYVTGGYLARNTPGTWREFDLYLRNYASYAHDFRVSERYPYPASDWDFRFFTMMIDEYKTYCRNMGTPPYMSNKGWVVICERVLGNSVTNR